MSRFSSYGLPACCGVNVLGHFGRVDGIYTCQSFKARPAYVKSGTGYYVSTFNQNQKKAYDKMCEHFDVVVQTPPKRNRIHGNDVFIVVFKEKSK